MRLADKVTIITGGGGGMGRVAALLFAKEGARVVVAEYSETAGQETVSLVQAAGGQATFVKVDVSSESDAKAMVDHAVATYGRVDCLYNNAGVMPEQMTFTGWNFDIVTGASALVVAGLVAAGRAPRALVLAWNVVGVALLVNVVAIAVVSTPLVNAFGTAPARVNTWIGVAPFSWLPMVFVVCAMAGHIAVTRRLLLEMRAAPVAASSAA